MSSTCSVFCGLSLDGFIARPDGALDFLDGDGSAEMGDHGYEAFMAGIDALVKSATAGTAKGMPPKGGRADLNAAQLRSVIEYMMSGGKAVPKATEVAAAKPAAARPAASAAAAAKPTPVAAAPAPAAKPAEAAPAAAPAAATAPATAAAPSAPTVAAARAAAPNPSATAEVNAFNRLLKPVGRFNRPAVESGIHDPSNDMTLQLQPPSTAFVDMPKSLAGNHVDWVKSLDAKAITPRWDRNDPAAAAVVMDLNIVREVKGSMPDVDGTAGTLGGTGWFSCRRRRAAAGGHLVVAQPVGAGTARE